MVVGLLGLPELDLAETWRNQKKKTMLLPSASRLALAAACFNSRYPKVIVRSPPTKAGGSSFFEVQLPPLPDGERLQLIEGFDLLEGVDGDEDAEDLADLVSVGGTIWPCAAALCRWLASNEVDVSGARVLELGAGALHSPCPCACFCIAARLDVLHARCVHAQGRERAASTQQHSELPT